MTEAALSGCLERQSSQNGGNDSSYQRHWNAEYEEVFCEFCQLSWGVLLAGDD